jgi:HSP20 family molecular chaperone IbpA
MEINYGVFESVIELPEGYDLGQAKAAYQNGFLRIDVPQKKRSAPKNISVLVKDEQ